MRRGSPIVALAVIAAACVAACADKAPAPAADIAADISAALPLTFDSARVLSAVSNVGAAPILALAPDGRYATAWVSAPDGGTDGRLYVQVSRDVPGSATDVVQRELRDALGPIEPHGEAPPKLAWSARANGSLTLGALYVVGKLVPGRRFPASALRFVRSDDGGSTWSAPVTVTDDTTKGLDADFGSHNFHALYAAPNGTFHVAWLDGRAGKSAVYTTHSTDGGSTWARNVRVVPIDAPLAEACPCCRTAIAADADGHVYLAWRAVIPDTSAAPAASTAEEHRAHGAHAAAGPTIRDIVVARSDDGGASWGAPQRVHADNWVFDGCPHAGPSLALDSTGALHAAWWTGKPGAAGVYYTRSTDRAVTFAPAIPLGVADASQPAHVQLAVRGRAVFATWDDGTKRVPAVVLRTSNDGGRSFTDAVTVSEAGKAASFPVLTATADARDITIAWSEQAAETADKAAQARPNMKDPKAVMPLPRVGNTQVLVRHAHTGSTAVKTAAASDAFAPVRVGDVSPPYAAPVVSANGTIAPVDVVEPGRFTLVNVWATWCTACREEMADLDALHREFAPRGLRVIGVSVDQGNTEKVVRYARSQRLGFSIAHDPTGAVQQTFGVVGVPETIFIDASGRVRAKVSGNVHGQLPVLRATIDSLLAPGAKERTR